MSLRSLQVLALALGLAIGGCNNGGGAGDGGEDLKSRDGGTCQPGQQVACPCLGGSMGVQTCRASGAGYDKCLGCPGQPPPDGGVSSTGCGDCAGCCGGSSGSTCVLFADETPTACGQKGDSCQPCAGGLTCAAGTCANDTGTCNSGSCSGCCLGTACITKTSGMACGSGGASCTQCSDGAACVNGACSNGEIDPNAKFTITVQSVKVQAMMPDGSSWDPFSGLPDPYVCMGWNDGTNFVRNCTDLACNDAVSCTFSPNDGKIEYSYNHPSSLDNPLTISGSAITNGQLWIEVWDRDDFPSPDDLIGSGYYGTTSLLPNYSTGPFGSVVDVTFTLN